jgi:hypothetical protein
MFCQSGRNPQLTTRRAAHDRGRSQRKRWSCQPGRSSNSLKARISGRSKFAINLFVSSTVPCSCISPLARRSRRAVTARPVSVFRPRRDKEDANCLSRSPSRAFNGRPCALRWWRATGLALRRRTREDSLIIRSPSKGEEPMWTLVIITIAFSGALSGASSSTSYLDFPDQSKCEAAATAIGAPDWTRIIPSGALRSPPVGGYRIIAKCVER